MLNGELGVSPGHRAHRLRAPGRRQRRDARQRRRRGPGAVRSHHRLRRRRRPAGARSDLTGIDLGGLTLTAGAYRYTSSAQLTGALTLDAQGDPNAQFVFEIGSTLTTASASSVLLINGASPCNVYWQVGSSATLGTTTAFQGNVLALTTISLNNGATVIGRVLARNGEVTLINNVLDGSVCATARRQRRDQTPPGGVNRTDAADAAAARRNRAAPAAPRDPVPRSGDGGRPRHAPSARPAGRAPTASAPPSAAA